MKPYDYSLNLIRILIAIFPCKKAFLSKTFLFVGAFVSYVNKMGDRKKSEVRSRSSFGVKGRSSSFRTDKEKGVVSLSNGRMCILYYYFYYYSRIFIQDNTSVVICIYAYLHCFPSSPGKYNIYSLFFDDQLQT